MSYWTYSSNKRSLRDEEFTASSFSHLLARHDGSDVYQEVTERTFGYTVLELCPANDDRKHVFSHLLTQEGFQR